MLTYKRHFKKHRKPAKPAPIRTNLAWSLYQRNIFRDISEGDGHTVVMAAPGSGKTKTEIEGLYHVPKNNRVLYTAFNRSISKEVDKYIPSGVVNTTNHGLGFRCIRRYWGGTYGIGSYNSVDSQNYSLFELANEQVGEDPKFNRLRQMLVKAIDLSKIVLADSPDKIEYVLDRFGISLCGLSESEFANHVWQMMEKTRDQPRILNNRSVITFSDMIWLPYVNGWQMDQFDYIFVDEAQDLSPARTELLLASLAPGGRVLACGDTFQAIYSFAGSTPNSIQNLTRTLNAKQLPLSVSYRCPLSVVELAKQINPMIEAAPNAEEGEVNSFDGEDLYDVVESGCVVLSRTNFPLVRACFGMLARGMNANIQGKDIGDRLLWRIECWQPESVQDLVRLTREWSDEVCNRLIRKRVDSTGVEDEAKCIETFAERCDTLDEVKRSIRKFFSDEEAQIKLSTAHKFKGLEKDKVFLLGKTFHPEKGEEETNIYYVAISRARHSLNFLEGKLP